MSEERCNSHGQLLSAAVWTQNAIIANNPLKCQLPRLSLRLLFLRACIHIESCRCLTSTYNFQHCFFNFYHSCDWNLLLDTKNIKTFTKKLFLRINNCGISAKYSHNNTCDNIFSRMSYLYSLGSIFFNSFWGFLFGWKSDFLK